MNKYIYAFFAAAIIGSFFMGMSYQATRTKVAAVKQEVKEVEKIGDIKAGDVKNESTVKEKLGKVDKDKSDVLNQDLPDSTIDLLGGVHKP